MSVDAVESMSAVAGGGPNLGNGPSPGGGGGSGGRRTRTTNRAYTAEDEALNSIAKVAEAKLAQRRAARAEARKIRMLELEKQQKEAEEQMDKEFQIAQEEKKSMLAKQTTQTVPTAAGAVVATVEVSTRRGSTDSIEQDVMKGSPLPEDEAQSPTQMGVMDLQEQELLKETVADLEEKYKKAMMTNAQQDNERSTLIYEVDALKDMMADQEEHMMELTREARDKHRDLEAKKRENLQLKRDVDNLKEMVEQRDQLISDHGLLLVGGAEETEGKEGPAAPVPKVGTIVVVSPEAAELLEVVGDGPLDVRLKRFVEERKELLEQIRKLKIELEEEKERAENAERRRANPLPTLNGPDVDVHEIQRETSKVVSEYKFKLQKAEQDVTNLGGQVVRLEGQVRRYKTSAEAAEQNEEELKQEKRKLTREVRILKDQIEELDTQNNHLTKRLEKFQRRKPEH